MKLFYYIIATVVTVTGVAKMKFYNRENELKILNDLYQQSEKSAKMSVLTGRRRIGKTLLSLEFCHEHKFIYLFVSKKSEQLLCSEYLDEIRKIFEIPVIGQVNNFKDVFSLLLQISQSEKFTLIIDEFQEFYKINRSVYSEIQRLWDLNKNKCKMHLIVIGSMYSLMHKIFKNSKEPLFGRADRIIFLRPFSISTMRTILHDRGTDDLEALFNYFVLTGGVPKYVDLLTTNSAIKLEEIIDFIVEENSPLIDEGKNVLIEEFGRDYGNYFSILELISAGKTSRVEIESVMEKHVGGYLDRLEKDYALISKIKPINAKPGARALKYRIIDNFLTFWFRFIYRNRSAVETGNFLYIKEIISRDYITFCGTILEKFFYEIFANTQKYNRIGSYWEKGFQNEIDLVAINDLQKELVLAEIKFNKDKININKLKKKSERLVADFSGYKVKWLGLCLDDAETYL